MFEYTKSELAEKAVLSDNEMEFLRLFKEKRFEPQLVFDDPQIIERLNKHPMVLWKLQIQER